MILVWLLVLLPVPLMLPVLLRPVLLQLLHLPLLMIQMILGTKQLNSLLQMIQMMLVADQYNLLLQMKLSRRIWIFCVTMGFIQQQLRLQCHRMPFTSSLRCSNLFGQIAVQLAVAVLALLRATSDAFAALRAACNVGLRPRTILNIW
jgi:uncharacterized membrane protein